MAVTTRRAAGMALAAFVVAAMAGAAAQERDFVPVTDAAKRMWPPCHRFQRDAGGHRHVGRDEPRQVGLADVAADFERAVATGQVERRFDRGRQVWELRTDTQSLGGVEPRLADHGSEIPTGCRDLVEGERCIGPQLVEVAAGRHFDPAPSGG